MGNVTILSQKIAQAISNHPDGAFDTSADLPISLAALFYFKRPVSHYKTTIPGEIILPPDAPKFATKTPDIDNVLKLVLDALQGVVCENNNQITEIVAKKLWLSNKPGSVYTRDAGDYE